VGKTIFDTLGFCLAVALLGIISHDALANDTEAKTEVGVERVGVEAYVNRVVDGDTLSVVIDSSVYIVRIKGLECPESRKSKKCKRGDNGFSCDLQEPVGKAASSYASAFIAGKTVYLSDDNGHGLLSLMEKDRWGRIIAFIDTDDHIDFAVYMIKGGYCWDVSDQYPHNRAEVYKAAQPIPPVIMKVALEAQE